VQKKKRFQKEQHNKTSTIPAALCTVVHVFLIQRTVAPGSLQWVHLSIEDRLLAFAKFHTTPPASPCGEK